MKYIPIVVAFAGLIVLCGCSEGEAPTMPTGRNFSGITSRDEWGDTLSVDSTDWVIVPSSSTMLAFNPDPKSSNPLILNRTLMEPLPPTNTTLSIGAFPNPFIPKTGRLNIALSLPQADSVSLRIEDESGDLFIPLFADQLDVGQYILSWTGADSSGNPLADGIYRVYFTTGNLSSFGDVQVIVSDHPDPPNNAAYVQFAQQNYTLDTYQQYEYNVVHQFGTDGILGGGDIYQPSFSTWQTLSYLTKFEFLPLFMNYDINSASSYQYHYLIAYKHSQFGAGWLESANNGIADSTKPEWQLQNSIHDTYVGLFQQGQ